MAIAVDRGSEPGPGLRRRANDAMGSSSSMRPTDDIQPSPTIPSKPSRLPLAAGEVAATPTPSPTSPRQQQQQFFTQYVHNYRSQVAADLEARQQRGAGVGNVAAGYPACNDVGNNVLACFPNSSTQVTQNEWSKFIWNTNYPTFIGAGAVDIYLFSADSEESVVQWLNIPNDRGSVGIDPNDDWLPVQSTWSAGETQTHSYYFIVATAGARITGGEPHQATFQMVQTAPPATLTSLLAAQSSAASVASAASASASAASATLNVQSLLSSLSAAGFTIDSRGSIVPVGTQTGSDGLPIGTGSGSGSSTGGPRRTNPSSLQNGDGSGSGLPKWAIALIAIFGFVTLLAALAGLWFLLGYWRRRRGREYNRTRGESAFGSDAESRRKNEEGDSSPVPIMAERMSNDGRMSNEMSAREGRDSASPLGIGAAAGGLGLLAGLGTKRSETSHSSQHPDDNEKAAHHLGEKPSQRSLAGSAINLVDAGIISDAFRNVLRKPEFPEHSSDEKTPSSGSLGGIIPSTTTPSGVGGAGGTKGNPFFSRGRDSGTSTPRRADSAANLAGADYGGRESEAEEFEDEQLNARARTQSDLMRNELESEGTSVRSVSDRRMPDIRHD